MHVFESISKYFLWAPLWAVLVWPPVVPTRGSAGWSGVRPGARSKWLCREMGQPLSAGSTFINRALDFCLILGLFFFFLIYFQSFWLFPNSDSLKGSSGGQKTVPECPQGPTAIEPAECARAVSLDRGRSDRSWPPKTNRKICEVKLRRSKSCDWRVREHCVGCQTCSPKLPRGPKQK